MASPAGRRRPVVLGLLAIFGQLGPAHCLHSLPAPQIPGLGADGGVIGGASSSIPRAEEDSLGLSSLRTMVMGGLPVNRELRDEAGNKFVGSGMLPMQFLLVSSPALGKVVYTQLTLFQSATGRTFPLIDSGLESPTSLAYDALRGKLYVADPSQRMVFRYSVYWEPLLEGGFRLMTDGIRLTVLVGRRVGGLAISTDGTLFFTDMERASVCKLSPDVLDMIIGSSLPAERLSMKSQRELEAEASSSIGSAMNQNASAPEEDAAPKAQVFSMYEAGMTSSVTVPVGIASDGQRLYWSNGVAGDTNGAVVEGEAAPRPPPLASDKQRAVHFPVRVLASNTNATSSIVQTSRALFYTGEFEGDKYVFAVSKAGGTVHHLVTNLVQPQGLVWDGDNTIFVADRGNNRVYSFPSGRLMTGVPLTPAVDVADASGLAFLSSTDKAWSSMRYVYSLAARGPPASPAACVLTLMAWLTASRAASA